MICTPCTVPDHEHCASVNCCCRHRPTGKPATVRPLTQHERHLLTIGLPLPTVLPVDEPEAFR